jgi:hypothetical protein
MPSPVSSTATSRRPVGCIYSVHPREQAIWTCAPNQGWLCPWSWRGFAGAPDGTPSKLSGRRSGLARESSIGPGRVGASRRAHWGTSPPSREPGARLERHQVGGRISNKCTPQASGPDLRGSRAPSRRSRAAAWRPTPCRSQLFPGRRASPRPHLPIAPTDAVGCRFREAALPPASVSLSSRSRER